MTDSPRGHTRRQAVVRTILIVVIVLGAAFAFAWTMTRRLISTWQPEPPAASAPATPR